MRVLASTRSGTQTGAPTAGVQKVKTKNANARRPERARAQRASALAPLSAKGEKKLVEDVLLTEFVDAAGKVNQQKQTEKKKKTNKTNNHEQNTTERKTGVER